MVAELDGSVGFWHVVRWFSWFGEAYTIAFFPARGDCATFPVCLEAHGQRLCESGLIGMDQHEWEHAVGAWGGVPTLFQKINFGVLPRNFDFLKRSKKSGVFPQFFRKSIMGCSHTILISLEKAVCSLVG